MFILLFIGAVFVMDSAIQSSNSNSTHEDYKIDQSINLHQEGGVFNRAAVAGTYVDMPEGNRTMDTYYENRAYPGAPPMIKHPLISEKGIGGKACLQCHQNGGFVPKFEAYAPVTPHPKWLNCRQCHLPITSDKLFKNTDWNKPPAPHLGTSALVTSPLIMPHDLQNRENCLSCHAGPAAPQEIKVTHPERINCRQCHVPHKTDNIYNTPIESRHYTFQNTTNSFDTVLTKDKDEIEGIKEWMNKEKKRSH